MRLTKEQVEQVRGDLKRGPCEFGYSQPSWTANCLARHLEQRYQVTHAVRHCRRLILQAKTSVAKQRVSIHLAAKPVVAKLPAWSGFSDEYRHKKVLHRLRRLSTSGLPLKQFREMLFEQITAASNSRLCKCYRWIFRDTETLDWTIRHSQELAMVNADDPEISGMLIPSSKLALVKRADPSYQPIHGAEIS